MTTWKVVVLVEPDNEIKEVLVQAYSETDAKPKAIRDLLNGEYRNKGCRFTVAEAHELPD